MGCAASGAGLQLPARHPVSLPLPSWHAIIGVTGTLIAFTFSIGSISLLAFRRAGLAVKGSRLPGMSVVAPLAFVISALVIYWVTWSELRLTIPIVVVGVIWYAATYFLQHHGVGELAGGVWLVVYLITMYVMSYIGSFGGKNLIHAPWYSVVVAAVAFAIYSGGVSSGAKYLIGRRDVIEDMRAQQEARDQFRGACQAAGGSSRNGSAPNGGPYISAARRLRH